MVVDKKVKIIIVSVLLLFIVVPLFIWGGSQLLERQGVAVSVLVLPSDATVKINNEEYTNKKTIYLKPGSYTATISKDGFEDDSRLITIADDSKPALISTLTPVSDEALRWVNENQSLYLELEGKAGEIATEQGQAFIEKYPITKWLPLQKSIFTIGYKTPDQGIIITISAMEGYREAALQEIRDRGHDPSDYRIEFTNYRSPFDE